MGALKPRESVGELEVCREGRRIVVRIPSDDVSERIVFSVDEQEARSLARALDQARDMRMTGRQTSVRHN